MQKKQRSQILNARDASCTQVSRFLVELGDHGDISECSFDFPCLIVKKTLKSSIYLSKILEMSKDTGLIYNVYLLNCNESDVLSITNILNDDIKDDNKKTSTFDLILVDESYTASEDVYVSFGTILEIYEYVVNRTIKPEEKLLADVYTRHRLVSGLVSARVLSGEKSNILILGEQHDKLDTCDEKVDVIDADKFFWSLLEKNRRTFIDVFGEFGIQMADGKKSLRERKLLGIEALNEITGDSFMVEIERSLTNQNCLYSSTEMSYAKCPFKD